MFPMSLQEVNDRIEASCPVSFGDLNVVMILLDAPGWFFGVARVERPRRLILAAVSCRLRVPA